MQPSPSFKPLENIALAISGGGFRAAAFGLGCLSYLHKIGYLRHVTFVSSASGGTLPAMLYSQYNYQGKTFEECYAHLCACMDGELLLKTVFDILRDDARWDNRPEKNRNLINAFAIAYDEVVFEKEEFGEYWKKSHKPHIQEVCFNATEFANGLSFRFQAGLNRNIGNFYLSFDNRFEENHARQLKLGDIMAASSCFPGGFEPLVFPNDFTHQKLTSKQIWEHFEQKPAYLNQYNSTDQAFGLMDGGIDDNQGVGSLLLADKYRKDRNRSTFDTVIVCDVDSSFTSPYVPPTKTQMKLIDKILFFQTLLFLLLGLLLFVVSALVLGLKLVFLENHPFKDWGIALTAGFVLTAFLIWRLIASVPSTKTVKKQLAKQKGTWGKMIVRYGGFFLNMPFKPFGAVIKTRLSSVSLMVGDLFLNQVRRLHFGDMYDDPHYHNIEDTNLPYANRCVSVMIHDLSIANESNLLPRLEKRLGKATAHLLTPSQHLKNLAEETRNMSTTLWFDENHVKNDMRGKLIACGQATMCFNLLKYLCELEKDQPALLTTPLQDLKKTLLTDWEKLNENPLSLLP